MPMVAAAAMPFAVETLPHLIVALAPRSVGTGLLSSHAPDREVTSQYVEDLRIRALATTTNPITCGAGIFGLRLWISPRLQAAAPRETKLRNWPLLILNEAVSRSKIWLVRTAGGQQKASTLPIRSEHRIKDFANSSLVEIQF